LALATEAPIHDISVAALCQRAGVTRDTFYRYASRPIDVLARAMEQDLPAIDELLAMTALPATMSQLEPPGRAVLEHVERNRQIYRHALHPYLDSALRDVLATRINSLLAGYLTANTDSLPAIGGSAPSAAEIRRLAIFTSSGIVGAIEDWLAQDEAESLERMLTLLFTAAAPWWRGSIPRTVGPAFGLAGSGGVGGPANQVFPPVG
jgi:AcrR family transcriptional regulator